MLDLNDLLRETDERRERDKARFEALDGDLCQLCYAYGCDKRSLVVDCFYAVHELVPEAIDLHLVEGRLNKRGYYLRICKRCRGEFLMAMQRWARERMTHRAELKDHDGDTLDDEDEERCVPMRVAGATVMMTVEQAEAHRARQKEAGGGE